MVVAGCFREENSQVLVCCEELVYLESSNMKEAVFQLIATYFVYNQSYPKPLLCLGVRELCWNNFGNNDGAKESRIIPKF